MITALQGPAAVPLISKPMASNAKSGLLWAWPSAPSQATSRADAPVSSAASLSGPAAASKLPHTCSHLLLHQSSECLVWLLRLAQTSFHRALEENFREHLKTINTSTSKAEFISSNIFPCTDHHLLWCSTPTTEHWYVASMRITYSEYVQPFFSHHNFILHKKKKQNNKSWKSHQCHFQRRIPECIQSLGNTICWSKGEDGPCARTRLF